MWKTKRKTKNERKKTKPLLFFSAIVLIVLTILVTYVLYNQYVSMNRFISPFPASFSSKPGYSHKEAIKELRQELMLQKFSISSITPSYESYIVTLENGEEVVFSDKKPFALQVSSLQLILTRLTIEGKAITRVDLRFDKPTVVLR